MISKKEAEEGPHIRIGPPKPEGNLEGHLDVVPLTEEQQAKLRDIMTRKEKNDTYPVKTLALDIETRPNVALVWDLWQGEVSPKGVMESSSMMCFAAKWIGQDEEPIYMSEHHDDVEGMIDRLWDLLHEADAVVHWNGTKFDIPYINMEFLRRDYLPPAPYKQVDLCATVKRHFRFPSRRLEFVSKELGLDGKVEHEGFPLWIKCMNGDEDAWERMKEYNIQDTVLLEDLYFKLRPWVSSLPSVGAMKGEDVCPTCGSGDLHKQGFTYTQTGRFQRWQCGDCGKWFRSTKRDLKTTFTQSPL